MFLAEVAEVEVKPGFGTKLCLAARTAARSKAAGTNPPVTSSARKSPAPQAQKASYAAVVRAPATTHLLAGEGNFINRSYA